MLTVRPAVAADAELIHQLVCELAEYEKLLHEVAAGVDDLRAILFCAQPRAFCDIAEWDRAPAGMALWFYSFSTFRGRHGIYLEDLFVRPEHRGRGLGKALLAGLARRCERENLARLEWAVLNWNTPSIGFYESLGARPNTEWTVYRLAGAPLQALGRTD